MVYALWKKITCTLRLLTGCNVKNAQYGFTNNALKHQCYLIVTHFFVNTVRNTLDMYNTIMYNYNKIYNSVNCMVNTIILILYIFI